MFMCWLLSLSRVCGHHDRTIEIPGFVFFHDFLVTEHYYIFTKQPLSFHPLHFFFGTKV